MTIQLADKSVTRPVGIARDVVIYIPGGICVPVDFVIMDVPEAGSSQIILGRPFMATAGVLVDVKNGTLSVNVGDIELEFTLPGLLKDKFPREETNHLEDIEEETVCDFMAAETFSDPIRQDESTDHDPVYDKAVNAYLTVLDAAPPDPRKDEEIFSASMKEDDPEIVKIKDHIDKAALRRQRNKKTPDHDTPRWSEKAKLGGTSGVPDTAIS